MGGSQRATQERLTDMVSVVEPTGISQYEQQFGKDYSSLASIFGSRIARPLNLEKAPSFSGNLDPIVQNQLSRAMQNIKEQQATEQRGSARALSVAGTGDNTALLNALQRQSKIAGAGAMNVLGPQALEAQRGFDLQRQQIIESRNRQMLAARAQGISELAPGLGLLQQLQGMAGVARGERRRTTGTERIAGGTSRSFF